MVRRKAFPGHAFFWSCTSYSLCSLHWLTNQTAPQNEGQFWLWPTRQLHYPAHPPPFNQWNSGNFLQHSKSYHLLRPSHSLSNTGDTCSPTGFSPMTSHPRLTLIPACPLRYQDQHLFHKNKNSSLLSILSSKSIVKLNCVSCKKNMKYFVSGYIFKSPPFLKINK